MNKLFIVGIVMLIVSGVFVFASNIEYSNPTMKNGEEIIWKEPNIKPIKPKCIKEEWDDNFNKFRAGIISKEDMKIYIRSCEW